MKTLDCLRVGDFVVLFICLFVCLHMMLTFLLGWFFLKGKFVCVMVVNNFNPSQEEEADGARSTECVLGQPVLHREILFRKKKKCVLYLQHPPNSCVPSHSLSHKFEASFSLFYYIHMNKRVSTAY